MLTKQAAVTRNLAVAASFTLASGLMAGGETLPISVREDISAYAVRYRVTEENHVLNDLRLLLGAGRKTIPDDFPASYSMYVNPATREIDSSASLSVASGEWVYVTDGQGHERFTVETRSEPIDPSTQTTEYSPSRMSFIFDGQVTQIRQHRRDGSVSLGSAQLDGPERFYQEVLYHPVYPYATGLRITEGGADDHVVPASGLVMKNAPLRPGKRDMAQFEFDRPEKGTRAVLATGPEGDVEHFEWTRTIGDPGTIKGRTWTTTKHGKAPGGAAIPLQGTYERSLDGTALVSIRMEVLEFVKGPEALVKYPVLLPEAEEVTEHDLRTDTTQTRPGRTSVTP
ncbi:hypothetical protein HZA57_00480 [Candidatus Poribacteria bacterium]|nr:hypothetical protein [Candidatus Poribacteria bacterium]